MSTYPDAPGHRHVDTSMAAADDLAPKLGRLQRMTNDAIGQAGWLGLTADELAATLGMDRWSIQPRTSELRRKGLIRDSGQRRPNATGKMAIVWVAT
jgi:predicted transcriptional regulator of viral defense system